MRGQNTFNDNIPPPLLTLPEPSLQDVYWHVPPKQVTIYEYCTISAGCRKIYTDKDALPDYGIQQILSPNEVSYTNLFINAVLQPAENYTVEKGKLTLHTEDTPLAGTPIILQMIKI